MGSTEKIFIDTGFILALIYPRDQYHTQALNLARKYTNNFFVTTDAVLLELGNAVARHSKPEAIVYIKNLMESNNIEIVRLNPELFDLAFELYKQSYDKTWGLVDCLSFVVMRNLDIQSVLSFDKHFTQAGFVILT
jgi:predicted nucleic acid-binding protein